MATSQRRHERSAEAVSRRVLSGLNDKAYTPPSWPTISPSGVPALPS